MAFKNVNAFLDKGSDWKFQVNVVGLKHKPLVLTTDLSFRAMARYIKNPKIQVKINCRTPTSQIGVLELYLPYKDTERMVPGEWQYDVEMTHKSGNRVRLIEGKIFVTDEVTTI